ncbi:uncharacterized protein LOC115222932 [Argonauta hians]
MADNFGERIQSSDPAVKELVRWYESGGAAEGVEGKAKEKLREILEMHAKREEYAQHFNIKMTPVQQEILHFTNTTDWAALAEQKVTLNKMSSMMASSGWAAQILKMLVSMQNATTVIEIGMFTGLATLAMAEALPDHGKLISCDIEPYLEKTVRGFVDKTLHGKKIVIKIGPALETLSTLAKEGVKADFVFIDADKSGYIDYFKSILDNNLLAPRGTIAFDNIYWGGQPYLGGNCENTVMAVNYRAIIDEPRVEQVMIPIRDGLALVRRVDDI